MNASIVDLRYKTREVMRALDRQERVTIFCRGKVKGVIVPVASGVPKRAKDLPMFGMYRHHRKPVPKVMDDFRGGRFRDL